MRVALWEGVVEKERWESTEERENGWKDCRIGKAIRDQNSGVAIVSVVLGQWAAQGVSGQEGSR